MPGKFSHPLTDKTESIAKAWQTLLADLNVNDFDATNEFHALCQRYAEPQRSYHTLAHIAQVLAHLWQWRDNIKDYPALQLAAWYHDAVYDPKARDNETASQQLAIATLKRWGLDEQLIARVSESILDTATHQLPTDASHDRRLFLDADLAILGASSRDYLNYAGQIRREYAMFDDETYHQGRNQVLQQFAKRKTLYFSTVAHERFTLRAYRNFALERAAIDARFDLTALPPVEIIGLSAPVQPGADVIYPTSTGQTLVEIGKRYSQRKKQIFIDLSRLSETGLHCLCDRVCPSPGMEAASAAAR